MHSVTVVGRQSSVVSTVVGRSSLVVGQRRDDDESSRGAAKECSPRRKPWVSAKKTSPGGAKETVLDGRWSRPATPRDAGATPRPSLCSRIARRSRPGIVRQRNLAPFTSIHDLIHRVPELRKDELNTLAEIGALNSVSSFQFQFPSSTNQKLVKSRGNFIAATLSGKSSARSVTPGRCWTNFPSPTPNLRFAP